MSLKVQSTLTNLNYTKQITYLHKPGQSQCTSICDVKDPQIHRVHEAPSDGAGVESAQANEGALFDKYRSRICVNMHVHSKHMGVT